MTLVEVCIDDLAGVGAVERAGADRIELCAALAEGGITPSIGTVAAALREARTIGVNVLVRQRPGDFVYSDDEIEVMADDIRAIRALEHDPAVRVGFVIGALTAGSTVDLPAITRLVAACGDAGITFHKAFDQIVDREAALDELVRLGIHRVLTSGGASSASEGAAALAGLVRHAQGRIVILAGGGVRPGNAAELIARAGVTEVHLRATETVPSAAAGAPTAYDSGARTVTSERVVREVLAAVGRTAG